MGYFFLLGIGLGLLDCLNPFTISMQVVLHGLVKKTGHVLYYIAGTFISYLLGGVIIYLGVDKLIAALIKPVLSTHGRLLFTAEVILGTGLVLLGLFFLIRQVRKAKGEPEISDGTAGEGGQRRKEAIPKSVHPGYLFFIGASGTLFDLPTALPYLAFIAKLAEAAVNGVKVLFLLIVYNMIYILPLAVLFVVYLLIRPKAEIIMEKARVIFALISEWAAVLLPLLLGVLLSIHGCSKLI